MENDFERYIDDNREAFENTPPPPEIWQKLQRRLVQHHEKKIAPARVMAARWAVAASVALIAGIGLIYFLMHQQKTDAVITKNEKIDQQKVEATATVRKKEIEDSSKQKMSNARLALIKNLPETKTALKSVVAGSGDDKHFTRLLFRYTTAVNEKEKQISAIQKISPELYNDFKKVTDDLAVMYKQLQDALQSSPDKEKVLETMVENLQMQETILSRQLQIIKKIQSPKNSSDEKPYDKI